MADPTTHSDHVKDTPDEFAGARELGLPPDTPSDLSTIAHLVHEWARENLSYAKRELQAYALIHKNPEHIPRIAAYKKFIATLKSSGLNDKEKIEAVNLWVKKAIWYDYDKGHNSTNNPYEWHQTTFTTLSTGHGQCSDIARLKYEMLKAVGIKDTNMRLVDGILTDDHGNPSSYDKNCQPDSWHEVLMVNVQGQNYILTNYSAYESPQGDLITADEFIKGNFVPISATNNKGMKTYPLVNTEDGNLALQVTQKHEYLGDRDPDINMLVSLDQNYSNYISTTRTTISPYLQEMALKIGEEILEAQDLEGLGTPPPPDYDSNNLLNKQKCMKR